MADISRRGFLRGALASLAGIVAGCSIVHPRQEAKKFKRRFHTIGHQLLDIESELGTVKQTHYDFLDTLIDEVKSKVTVKDSYTKDEAHNLLNTIDDIFEKKNLERKPTSTLTEAIDNKQVDCDIYSYFYLAIADELNLPLTAVCAPSHMLLKWDLNDKEFFYFESMMQSMFQSEDGTPLRTLAYFNDIKSLKNIFNIDDKSLEKGVFLKSLTEEEILATYIGIRGCIWNNRGEFDKALKDYNKALEIKPDHSPTYHNRANLWNQKGEHDKAIQDYTKSIELDPNSVLTHFSRANTYEKINDNDNAIKDYTKTIQLAKECNNRLVLDHHKKMPMQAHFQRGLLLIKKKQYDKAIEDFTKVIELDPKHELAYRNRSVAYRKLGDEEKADSDYEKANNLSGFKVDVVVRKLGEDEQPKKQPKKYIKPTPVKQEEKSNGFPWAPITIAVGAIAAIGAGIYYLRTRKQKNKNSA
jgi:tetratricopeptide (TPR) repeat protein